MEFSVFQNNNVRNLIFFFKILNVKRYIVVTVKSTGSTEYVRKISTNPYRYLKKRQHPSLELR